MTCAAACAKTGITAESAETAESLLVLNLCALCALCGGYAVLRPIRKSASRRPRPERPSRCARWRSDRMRVALVTPPYHAGGVESAGCWPHLGFVYIAGALRAAGHEPAIYDAMSQGHSLAQVRAGLRRLRPD